MSGLTASDTDPATGGIASRGTKIFIADASNTGGDLGGVIMFDTANSVSLRLSQVPMRDINVGLDGVVYALNHPGTTLYRFDSSTGFALGSVAMPVALRAVAVDAAGTIYGAAAAGQVHVITSLGAVTTTIGIGSDDLDDIDINVIDDILITSSTGNLIRTNASFSTVTVVPTPFVQDAFAAFSEHPTQSSRSVFVTLVNGDPSEISVQTTVLIKAGEASVTVPVDAVDDNMLDGTQIATLTAVATGYVNGSDTIEVLDAEAITLDIVDAVIAESAGAGATQVKLTRSDIDGPFPHLELQSRRDSTVQTILDNDVTFGYITFPSQYSFITDVDLTLSLTHTWIADLDIFLVSPSGTRVRMVADLISNEHFMTGTIFDDEARIPIRQAASPFTGRVLPEQPLSTFDGENPSGQWRLEVIDDNQNDSGTLFSWSLDIRTRGPEAVTVSLSSSDTTEATVASSVTIPANQIMAVFDVNAIDDSLLDGTQTVIITETGASHPSFALNADTVDVTDDEVLTLTVSETSVSEAAGAGALTGRVTRFNSDISAPFVVTLFSSDTTELTVPATVTIPANESFAEFPIDAVDDSIFDGTQTVTITAQAAAYGADKTVDIDVLDLEPSLQLSPVTTTVREDAGSLTVRLSRLDQSDLSQSVSVNLSSSDTTELIVPASVIIPAFSDHVDFIVTVVDDAFLDGTQLVTLMAAGSAQFSGGSVQVAVEDHETLTVVIGPSSFLENAGAGAAVGSVSRSNTSDLGQPLTVTLANGDNTELSIPATVTIPAGLTTVTFAVDAVNDPVIDGPQIVNITASAAGYVNGATSVTVLDHEPPVLTTPAPVTSSANPVITWNAIPGALRYDVWIDDISNDIYQIIRNPAVTGTSFTPSEQLGVGRYRVWVRAYDSLERPGFWSVPRQFRVDTAPVINAPQTSAVEVSGTFPRISWSAIANTAHYDLWIDNLTTNTSQVIRRNDLVTTSFLQQNGLGSGSYRAWVRSINAAGDVGRWSDPVTFSVLASPTLLSPTGATFDTTPTISWSQVSGASHYDLWVSSLKTGTRVIRNTFVASTQFDVPQDLEPGEYAVWVRSGSGTQYGPWSAVRKFAVAAPPVISSPVVNGTTGTTPSFVWSSVSGAESYEIWVSHNDTNNTGRVLYAKGLTSTSFNSATLAAGNYRVWIRAISEMGVATKWSAFVDFRVAAVDDPSLLPTDTPLLTSLKTRVSPIASTPTNATVPGRVPAQSVASASAAPASVSSSQSTPTEASAESAVPVVPIRREDDSFDQVMSNWSETEWWAAEPAESKDGGNGSMAAAAGAGLGLWLNRPLRRRRTHIRDEE
ncbi:MAG: proprotein convertase P-domain-containing protein [Planctomycetaceae bacterium]|nr:proprotein convertase P-domain-containing protein [Planctomycetaceae bacterium]